MLQVFARRLCVNSAFKAGNRVGGVFLWKQEQSVGGGGGVCE